MNTPNKRLQYKLRPRNHNLTLSCKTLYYHSCNFITRITFYHHISFSSWLCYVLLLLVRVSMQYVIDLINYYLHHVSEITRQKSALRADRKNATQISTRLSATQHLSLHSTIFHCKKILCSSSWVYLLEWLIWVTDPETTLVIGQRRCKRNTQYNTQ